MAKHLMWMMVIPIRGKGGRYIQRGMIFWEKIRDTKTNIGE